MSNILNVEFLNSKIDSRFELKNITFKIESGLITGVIGPNGSGKTTLLKIISGLLNFDNGLIEINGNNLLNMNNSTKSKLVTFTPQTYIPVFDFTVYQTVLLGRLPYNLWYKNTTEFDESVCEECMILTDIHKLKELSIKKISGGELQRVMIAKALAQETKLIVLDEPLTHLDPFYQKEIFKNIQILCKKNIKVIASFHDINFASSFCENIIALHNGEIISQGEPNNVITKNVLHKLFNSNFEIQINNQNKITVLQNLT